MPFCNRFQPTSNPNGWYPETWGSTLEVVQERRRAEECVRVCVCVRACVRGCVFVCARARVSVTKQCHT